MKGSLAATALLGGGSAAYAASSLDRHDLEIVKVRLHLGLHAPLRAAQLSDIHFDPLYEIDWLKRVFGLLGREAPDIVWLTGDYVSNTTARFGEFGAIAATLRPRLGIWASMGNHDHWHGPAKVAKVLAQNGVRVLRNEVAPLPGHPGWALVGLDSYWGGRPNPGILARQPRGTRFIALVHEPDAWTTLRADPRIRLQVSGHTHGGQVRAPFLGALQLPAWGKRYDAGLFRHGEQALYVNRGIGTVRIPARWNCRPEITLFELT